MVKVQVNPNFHVLGGKDILAKDDPAFQEYRKKWEERPKTFTAGEFPLHIDIEASCLCNLRCKFCATNYEPIGGKGFMSFETFKKIIDEGAKNGLCAIKLNSGGRGEPLLNPLVPEMIAYAKSKNIIDVYLNTNATLLTREIGEKLIHAGLDRISISFEGISAEEYEKYRIGASFNKVLKNIKEFIALRNEINAETPKVRVQTVALPELQPKLDEYTEFWGEIVDEVAFIDFKDYSHIQQDLIDDWACPYLWQRLMVRWDGTISVCQFDYSNSYPLGNINKGDTIRYIWNGDAIKKIREISKNGKLHKISICNGCSFRTTEILKQKKKKKVVAILIGRESSTGFPGKNIYPVLGRPLMTYPILAANGTKQIDQIYISTDSIKIKEIAKEYGCKIIDRPAELCTTEARCEDVFIHAYEIIKKELAESNDEIELLSLLMCNAPMITSEKLDEGIKVLRDIPEYDSAVTVSRYNMFSPLRARKICDDGLLHPFVPHEQIGDISKLDSDRDSQGDTWFADMGVSIIRPRNLLQIEKGLLPQKWMGQKIYPLKQEGGFDIDYEEELPQVENWLKKQGFTEDRIPQR